jgi:ribonuclease E
MTKRMLIDALHPEETRVVIADENQIYDFDFVSTSKKQLKGNIYLAKITRVEPSLQAAFVEYGCGKQGFLPFSEIHTDYYQIPVSDRKRLMEEAASETDDGTTENSEDVNTASDNSENNNDDSASDATLTESQDSQDTEGQSESDEVNQERPAYLMQGAIDISISEESESTTDENNADSDTNIDADDSSDSARSTSKSSENDSEDSDDNAHTPDKNPTTEDEQSTETEKEDVETLDNDGEDEQDKRKRNVFMRRYKIQEVIRRGQIVLMQVIKEERGNKGVSLTTYLSLAGRYCVLMPNSPKDGGISRKIASAEDRKRLKAISTEFRLAEGMSVIIRTAGMDRTHAEIKRDFDYLVKLWNAIREDTLKSNAPALIYEESDIVKRAIRDQYSNDIEEIVIEGKVAYKSAHEFMKLLLPSHLPKIKNYDAQTPLFYAYNIENQLLSMHDPVVKMKSGAYLVINPTEALISIDVNSGRATGERNIEETALKTNLEAAAEVARQLRLRDLAGLVVIDFIDMLESRNRRAIEKMLKDSMKTDRAKIQLGRISPFGLLEMSRQRLRSSISETNMTQCPHCIGRGIIRSHESLSIQVIRAIEKESSSGNACNIRVVAPQELAMHMLNYKRDSLSELEKRYNVSIQILINPELASSEFNIEKIRRAPNERVENTESRRPKRQERPERTQNTEAANNNTGTAKESNTETSGENSSEPTSTDTTSGDSVRRSRRRGRRNTKANAANRPDTLENSETGNENNASDIPLANDKSTDETPTTAVEGGEAPAKNPPRERGGRGRRKWRDRGDRPKTDGDTSSEDAPTSWDGGAAALADSKSLPAFASDLRQVVVPAPPTYKAFHDHKPTEQAAPKAQSEESSSPPKRGWWQKMISLDE